MDAQLRSLALDLMEGHENLNMATLRDDGWPQTTTVGYVNDGLILYFACGPESQKAANIRRDGRVSLTIDRDYADWSQIKGLSMAARAEIVADPEELDRVRDLMLRKFPALAAMEPLEAEDFAVVRLTPTVMSILDYTRGFGHADLVEVSPADLRAG